MAVAAIARTITFLCLMAGLAIFFLAVPSWSLSTFVLLGIFVFCGAELVVSIFSPARSVTSIMFWFFWAFMVTMPGAAQSPSEDFYFNHTLSYTEDLKLWTAFVLLVFLVCYALAYRALEARAPRTGSTQPYHYHNAWALVLRASLGAGLAFSIVWFGSFGYVFQGDDASILENFDPLTYNVVIVAPRSLLTASIYVMVIALTGRHVKSATTLIVASLLLFLQLAFYSFVADPTGVTRYITFSFAITLFLLFVRTGNAEAKGISFGLMFITLFSAFPMLRMVRYGEVAVLASPDAYLLHGDLDGFQSMMNIVALAGDRGHTWGLQMLSALLFFVPRSMWLEKSVGTGELGAVYAGYDNLNVSSPTPIEFYLDFGLPGVIACAIIIAYFMRQLDKSLRAQDRGSMRYILSAVIAGFILIMLRGSLIGVIAPPLCTMGAVWAGLARTRIAWISRSGPRYGLQPRRGPL